MSTSIDTSTLNQLGLAQRAPEGPRDKLGQDDFMRLMITQLRNQDPFAPMESGEFLGQLAQFGTVSGIDDVRRVLETLSGALTANHALQAASLIERDVLVPSHEAWLPPEGQVSGAVAVPPGVADVTVSIYDLNGRLVGAVPVGDGSEGHSRFEWDGVLADGTQAPAGFYELRASGLAGGRSVALEALVSGRVESVSVGAGDGLIALTVTGLGVVDFSRIRGIG